MEGFIAIIRKDSQTVYVFGCPLSIYILYYLIKFPRNPTVIDIEETNITKTFEEVKMIGFLNLIYTLRLNASEKGIKKVPRNATK